ncbi:MAG: 4-alpha-glucanotransferase [Prevotella sp.]|nr:4-alpha-glucanotransferase [Prevotella sp.]
MKLKFIIHYITTWGQGLYVSITFNSEGGRPQRHLMPMVTEDGETWTLETAAVESRQRPVTSICYHYQVMDGDGRLLRREWDKVPRVYAFDSTRDYVFPDRWRDTPLQAHLYTEAFHVTTNHGRHQPVGVFRLPLFRRTVVFRVSAPQLRPGESVGICGSHPAMGSWSPSRFLRMNPVGDGEWMLSVNIEGMPLPLEYKYVVVDDKTNHLVSWEEGDNRSTHDVEMRDGEVLVLYGDALRVCEAEWKAAGVAVPVFSLRSERSCGVGDFGDLPALVDWAVDAGLKVVQLLPVADTTTMHSWTDSHPYNVISAFALHPHYLALDQLDGGTGRQGDGENTVSTVRTDEERAVAFHRQRRELNALDHSDYMAVDRVKSAYVDEIFLQLGADTLRSDEYAAFVAANEHWLLPYCAFCILRDMHHTARTSDWGEYADYDEGRVRLFLEQHSEERDKIAFVQFHLHRQLKAAADYAHERGVALMGDLPIGIYRDSVETWQHPDFFHLDAQVGTPPDQESFTGQNWGFPPYRWTDEEGHHHTSVPDGIFNWFRQRFHHLEQYFDAIRIDHAVGYFRIWEIPDHAVLATMGHFAPALPLSEEEITRYGLPFRRELYTHPFINDRILDRFFGIHAAYVKEHFLVKQHYGLYALREEYDTQVKVRNHFGALSDENSLWIRDGLYRLIANVLFMEDRHMPGMYHPRFMVYNEPVYDTLGAEEKDAFMRLYNNYYYERHNDFWAYGAQRKLGGMLAETRMLVCAEDLGLLPACVGEVLDNHRILTTEIQTLPKQPGMEFAHLEANSYRSLCTISTHDMPPLRLWWEENIGRTQRYYATMLQRQGRAPQQLPAHIAEQIIARHMFSPSMLCIIAIQDWLAMDNELREPHAYNERINSPYDVYNQWKYRMPVTLEQLAKAGKYNNKLRTMTTHSKRG